MQFEVLERNSPVTGISLQQCSTLSVSGISRSHVHGSFEIEQTRTPRLKTATTSAGPR
jgi:hypothetical protein